MTWTILPRAIIFASLFLMLIEQPPLANPGQPESKVASPATKAIPKLRPEIGPADMKKVKDIRDGKDWRAPWIRIHAGTVDISARDAQGKQTTITVPVLGLREALIKLPLAAWPYGRLIASSSGGPQGVNDMPRSEKDKTSKQVAEILKSMDVAISLWP